MKTKLLIILGAVVLAFTACNISGESNFTPQFAFVTNPRSSSGDTLYMKSTGESNVYLLDTIYVGDTIFFPLYMNGYSNNLQTFTLKRSTDYSADLLLPRTTALDSVFNSFSSDYDNGKFVFQSGIKAVYFPFRYVPTDASSLSTLVFTVASDANFDYSVGIITLKTPIKAHRKATRAN